MRRGGHGLRGESTDYTDYTYYLLANGNYFCQRRTRRTRSFFVNRFFIANGEHEEHEVFFSKQICFCQRRTRRTRSFLVNRLHRLHRKLTSCYSCHPLAKGNNQCNLCNLLTTKKPCYPHGRQSLVKVKFAIYYSPLNHYMLFVCNPTCRIRTCRCPSTSRS